MSIAHDIAEYLEDNSIGTVGTDIFSNETVLTTDNVIGIFDLPGPEDYTADISDSSFQVLIRNTSQATAHTKADSIRALLHDFDGTIEGNSYLAIYCSSVPNPIGRDESNRYRLTMTFRVVRAY